MGNILKKHVNFENLQSGQICRGEKALFVIKTDKMHPDVLNFILGDKWLQKTDQDLLEYGFYKTDDHPFLKDQFYFEGYFHGLGENNPISSLNPRNGQPIEKPAAPPRLRAFIQATQKKNRHILRKISEC